MVEGERYRERGKSKRHKTSAVSDFLIIRGNVISPGVDILSLLKALFGDKEYVYLLNKSS